jgi:hypothetical protein
LHHIHRTTTACRHDYQPKNARGKLESEFLEINRFCHLAFHTDQE